MPRHLRSVLSLVVALIFAILPALASDNEHAYEAEYHLEEAVKHAGMGHAKMVTAEAEKGLRFAKMAVEADSSNPELKLVVNELEKAIKQGKSGNAAGAGKHAKAALSHLKKTID